MGLKPVTGPDVLTVNRQPFKVILGPGGGPRAETVKVGLGQIPVWPGPNVNGQRLTVRPGVGPAIGHSPFVASSPWSKDLKGFPYYEYYSLLATTGTRSGDLKNFIFLDSSH